MLKQKYKIYPLHELIKGITLLVRPKEKGRNWQKVKADLTC